MKSSDKNESTPAPSSPPATPVPVHYEAVSFPLIKEEKELEPVDESMLFEGDTMTETWPPSTPKQHKLSQSLPSSPSTPSPLPPPPPRRLLPRPIPSPCKITLPSLKQLESEKRASSERSSSLLIKISGLSKSESERAICCYERPASSPMKSNHDCSSHTKPSKTTDDKNPIKTETGPEIPEPSSLVEPPVRRSGRHKARRRAKNYWTVPKPNKRRKKQSRAREIDPTEFRYGCDLCEKTFRQKSQWKRHVDCVHLKIAKFECEECGRLFKRTDHLKNHLHRMH
ncbi:unnamed protein product [Ambrosiozyma monospora]|uniref:Unnamed protein product n=1 Tax=Ambrosiozyma monospora TaxID=43982 RepID=A0ACB5TWE2_AMBMO|nr:unnamed protein product [Ambrosiozyma monospora]